MASRLLPPDFDITLCKDNYGQSMQTSSLADWVELLALCGMIRPWKSMAETMREAGISGSLIDEAYTGNKYVEEELETNAAYDVMGVDDEYLPEGSDETVRRIIDFRMQYLKESYPFRFDEFDRLTVVDGFPVESSSYIELLRLSLYMGWAYRLPDGSSLKDTVTHLFEGIVSLALKNAGLNSAVMGTSQPGTFESRLQKCGTVLDLNASTRIVHPSRNAQDEGVDIIGGFLWRDHRIGEPAWLIQATCGKNRAGRWKEKLHEPDSGKWSEYLSIRTNPMVFLAVPYHMTTDVIDRVVPHHGPWSFIDRLRIVKMAGQTISYDTSELAKQGATIKNRSLNLWGMLA